MDIRRRDVSNSRNEHNGTVALQGQVVRCNARFFLLMWGGGTSIYLLHGYVLEMCLANLNHIEIR